MPGDRQDGAGRPQDVAQRRPRGPGRSRAVRNASTRALVVLAVADVDHLDLDAEPLAQREQRARGRPGARGGW